MKKISAKESLDAFTLIELLVVVIILAVFVALTFPMGGVRSGRARVAVCSSNIRQVGIGIIMFTADYTNNFPWQISATNGGSMESVALGSPASHFKTITNYNENLPRLLLCPTDQAKRPADVPLTTINDSNISYFVNMDAALKADALLIGDRNLEIAGRPLKPGLVALPPNPHLNWGPDLHKHGSGMMLFGDGHSEFIKSNSLMVFSSRWTTTNRLAIP